MTTKENTPASVLTDAELIATLSAGIDCWMEIEPEDRGDILTTVKAILSAQSDKQVPDEEYIAGYRDECAAMIAEAKKDAERYRWLRNPDQDVALVIDKRTEWVPPDDAVPGVGGYWMYEYRAGDELDAAIDAAMQGGKQG